MYNIYPHSTLPAELTLRSSALRVNQRARIKNESIWKESATMHSSLFTMDAHVRATTAARLDHALTAKQIRVASEQQETTLSRLVETARLATGKALIAAGTWLQRETATTSPRGLETRHATRSSTATP